MIEWTLPLKLKLLKPQQVRSFVTRQGRLTKSQRTALETLWPEYGIEIDGVGNAHFTQALPHVKDHVLEIGFGDGDTLAQMAEQQPTTGFYGVEVHQPGVGALLRKAKDLELNNLKILYADARDVLEKFVPDGFLDRVQIFFPDPWPKKRHNKRRIVQTHFIESILPKIKAGGCIHCATDWQPYAEHMLEVLQAIPQLKNASTHGDYVARPAYRPETKFERRGERLGHGVWDLIFTVQ